MYRWVYKALRAKCSEHEWTQPLINQENSIDVLQVRLRDGGIDRKIGERGFVKLDEFVCVHIVVLVL